MHYWGYVFEQLWHDNGEQRRHRARRQATTRPRSTIREGDRSTARSSSGLAS